MSNEEDDSSVDVEYIVEDYEEGTLAYFVLYTNGEHFIGSDTVYAHSLEEAHGKAHEGFVYFPQASNFYVDILH